MLVNKVFGGGSSDAPFNIADIPVGANELPSWNTGMISFMSSTGTLFISKTSSSGSLEFGIWRFDRPTKQFIQVHPYAYNWANWYEASDGSIFCSGGKSSPQIPLLQNGLLKYNPQTDSFVSVCDSNTSAAFSRWFEDGDDLFVGHTASGANLGVYWYDVSVGKFVYKNNTISPLFHKNNNGVYVYTTTSQQWLRWDSVNKVFVTASNVPAITFQAPVFHEDEIFITNSSQSGMTGILRLDTATNTWVSVYSTGLQWRVNMIGPGNTLFLSSSNSTHTGILCWDTTNKVFVQVYTAGYNYTKYFITSQGLFFAAVPNNILRWNGASFDKLTGTILYDLYEASDGSIYATLASLTKYNSSTGQFVAVGVTVPTLSNPIFRFEDSSGRIYLQSTGTAASSDALMQYTPNTNTLTTVYPNAKDWSVWVENADGLYVSGLADLGLLKYDSVDGVFKPIRYPYNALSFGEKYTITLPGTNENGLACIYEATSDRRAFLPLKYTGRLESGPFAVSFSNTTPGTPRTMLWVE